MKDRAEMFWDKVEISTDKENGCWNWTGSRSGSGYGQFWNGVRTMPAHWFLLTVKPVRPQEACHKCDNKLCVRPSHIFIGSRSDNMQDMVAKGRHNPAAKAQACRNMLKVRRVHRGSNNHEAVLTEADVAMIKAVPRTRGIGAAIARYFKVSQTVVSGIFKGSRWGHVKPDAQALEKSTAFCRTLSPERFK